MVSLGTKALRMYGVNKTKKLKGLAPPAALHPRVHRLA